VQAAGFVGREGAAEREIGDGESARIAARTRPCRRRCGGGGGGAQGSAALRRAPAPARAAGIGRISIALPVRGLCF
jgi:hypothetical protein